MADVYVIELCYFYEGCTAVSARMSLESAREHVRIMDQYLGQELKITRFDTVTGDGTVVSKMSQSWSDNAPVWEETFTAEGGDDGSD